MKYGPKDAYYKVTLPNGLYLICDNGAALDRTLKLDRVLQYQPQQIRITIETEDTPK